MRRDIELCTMVSWLVECSEVSVRHSWWVGATQQRHVARRCTVDSRNGSWRPLPICSLNHYHHDSFIKSAAKLPLPPSRHSPLQHTAHPQITAERQLHQPIISRRSCPWLAAGLSAARAQPITTITSHVDRQTNKAIRYLTRVALIL